MLAQDPHTSLLRWRAVGRAVQALVPSLERREATVGAIMMIVASLVLAVLAFLRGQAGHALLGVSFGADFANFYVAGKMLNEYPAERLYDIDLQARLYHDLAPDAPLDRTLVFPYAPVVAELFRPFAKMPYLAAAVVWTLCSVGLYLAGLHLACLGNVEASQRASATILAFSFVPFLVECCLGGQLSAVAFFSLALAIRLEQAGMIFASGLAAGLCWYKPTMLVWVLPMMLITRRWKALGGAAVAALMFAVLSLAMTGSDGVGGYLRTMQFYGDLSLRKVSPFPVFKFVDLSAFFSLLPYGGLAWSRVAAALALAAASLYLLRFYWRRRGEGQPSAGLVWAATIVGTLVINVHVPIYDVTLAVIGVFLTAGAIRQRGSRPDRETFFSLTVVLYLASLLTQACALYLHLQPLTIVLWAMGCFCIALAENLSSRSTAVPGMPAS